MTVVTPPQQRACGAMYVGRSAGRAVAASLDDVGVWASSRPSRAAALWAALLVPWGCVPVEQAAPPEQDSTPAVGSFTLSPLEDPVHRAGFPLLYRPEDEGEASGIDHITDLAFSTEDSSLDDFTGGFAVLDCDLDGDADLVFTSGTGANQLFVNDGHARFEVASDVGVALPGEHVAGASVADYDRDGDPDLLLLVQHGDNRLLANDGACSFEDVTEQAGLQDGYRSLYANWADLDGDGWLDLYVASWGERAVSGPPTAGPEPDRLWFSDGQGGFVDVTEHLPEATASSYGMMVGFLDLDGDEDLDLLLWNDKASLGEPAHLFRNDGASIDGLDLVDVSAEVGFDLAEDGMDLSVADFDRDGDPDIALSGGLETVLLNHEGRFVESGAALGVGDDYLDPFSWAMAAFDPDGDGDQDLFITRSHFFDQGPDAHDAYLATPLLYRNDLSETGEFVRLTLPGAAGDAHTWRGAAAIDLNGDGFEDLVTSSGDEPARILLANPPTGRGVVQVRLHGVSSNREGRGAVVRLETADLPLVRWPGAAPPYSSGTPTWLTFGLHDQQIAGPLEIRWPSGAVQRVQQVQAGTRIDVFEPG